MKRLNLKSPIAIAMGFICVFVIVYLFSWILEKINLELSKELATSFLTKEAIHKYQGFFLITGSMIGAYVTSAVSPNHETGRTSVLGIIVIVFVIIGVIRSETQSLFDAIHVIVYIFTIPCMWLVSLFVKKRYAKR